MFGRGRVEEPFLLIYEYHHPRKKVDDFKFPTPPKSGAYTLNDERI
jgi:hypothetical protein